MLTLRSQALLAALGLLLSCSGPGADLNSNNNGADGGTTTGDSGTLPGSEGGVFPDSSIPAPSGTSTFTDPFKGAPPYAAPSNMNDGAHNAFCNPANGGTCSQTQTKGCMSPGCHSSGDFLIGGTVFKDYAGTIPAAGVEVRVMDKLGNTANTYSATNGNFSIGGGQGNNVTTPFVVGVRDATISRPMITPITGTMGTCSWAGCHVGTGGYFLIHIP